MPRLDESGDKLAVAPKQVAAAPAPPREIHLSRRRRRRDGGAGGDEHGGHAGGAGGLRGGRGGQAHRRLHRQRPRRPGLRLRPPDGHDIFEALGDLLIDARCDYDREHCLEVCTKLCEKLGSHGIVKPKAAVRSLVAPLRMNAGMEEEKAPKKIEYIFDAPPLSSRDKVKIERNKRKEDRQREA